MKECAFVKNAPILYLTKSSTKTPLHPLLELDKLEKHFLSTRWSKLQNVKCTSYTKYARIINEKVTLTDTQLNANTYLQVCVCDSLNLFSLIIFLFFKLLFVHYHGLNIFVSFFREKKSNSFNIKTFESDLIK